MLEDSSVIYYVPQHGEKQDYLYYPQCAGYFQCNPTYQVERNNFNSYLLIVMLSGALSYTALRSRGVVHQGQALLLDCHQPHSYHAQGECSFVFVHFDGGQCADIYASIESTLGNIVRLPSASPISESIGEIIDRLAHGKRIGSAYASALVYGILMDFLAADPVQSEGSSGHPTIDQAMEYIHRHLGEKLTVKEIARHIGYSESYFAHKFQEITGESPYQFLLRSRLERSQQLLQTTALSIQEIAGLSGFGTVANFSHAFKKAFARTPHEYRERPV